MSNIPETFIGKVKTIYKKNGYLDKYGGSVIITGLLLFITWLILSYHIVMRKVAPIKADWVNQRCSPSVMPFAGLINGPPGQSKFAYAGQNFTNCVSNILKQILGDVMKPVYAVEHLITEAIVELHKAIQDIRLLFDRIRTAAQNMIERILNRILNSVTPVMLVTQKMKDLMLKTGGVLTETLMMLLGLWYTMKSALGAFIELCIAGIIILVAMIAVFWTDPFTWWMAIIATIIFVFLAVMVAIMVYWINYILGLTQPNSVPPSSCFDENTPIMTHKGLKPIKEIVPGEILADGAKITAVFKMTSEGEDIYEYEKVIVSGSHKIMTPCGKCVSVSSHPQSRLLSGYTKPYLYCLSTTTKTITVNGVVFSDWDEVDNHDWHNIQNRAEEYLSSTPERKEIHTCLESGFGGETEVLLRDGSRKYIKEISVGDYLKNGEKVLGIVRILADDVVVKKYNIKGNWFICSTNVPFVNDNLGNMTTKKMEGKRVFLEGELYHIITDTKFLTINNVQFHDYNAVIEKIMEGPKLLFPSF